MHTFRCPFLEAEVELTDERHAHIAAEHPELLPEHRALLAETLAEPDTVRRNSRSENTRLFTRWFPGMRGGKHVVVVVASDTGPISRHWVVTAYLTRRLAQGARIEWTKD